MYFEWMKIVIGAVFEVCWVVGLKHAHGFWSWSGTIIAIIISFYLLINAGRKLPAGTLYAVFVGLGTAGTVLSESIFFGVPFRPIKIFLIALLLVGVIGLKLITGDEEKVEPKGVDS